MFTLWYAITNPNPTVVVESCEFVILGRPVSVHTRSRAAHRHWKEAILIEAIRNALEVSPFTCPVVRLTIVFLCDHRKQIDVDNVIKPIQDALSGVFYHDDEMVSDVEAHRRTWADDLKADRLPRLLRTPWRERRECVYVRVQETGKLEELL